MPIFYCKYVEVKLLKTYQILGLIAAKFWHFQFFAFLNQICEGPGLFLFGSYI